jgi:uncharacterized protein involved in exopolysaccharide biosynthesis
LQVHVRPGWEKLPGLIGATSPSMQHGRHRGPRKFRLPDDGYAEAERCLFWRPPRSARTARGLDRLRLQKKWGSHGQILPKEFAYNKLKRNLTLQEIRNTNLIQITVFSVDPAEAALLANTIAQFYMDQRIAEQQNIVAKGLEQLQDDVKQKEKDVNDAYVEASKLRTEYGIVDPNPDTLDNSTRVEDSSVLANQAKVDQAQAEVATLRSRVEQLDRLKRDDLMRAAGLLNLNDPIIEQKLPLYEAAQAEKARLLNSGLGKKHPDVKAQQAQIDVLERQLSEQIDSLLQGLEAQQKIAENSAGHGVGATGRRWPPNNQGRRRSAQRCKNAMSSSKNSEI